MMGNNNAEPSEDTLQRRRKRWQTQEIFQPEPINPADSEDVQWWIGSPSKVINRDRNLISF